MPAFIDVRYRIVSPTLHLFLDVYQPSVGEGPFPAVMVIHGGSWKSGCKGSMDEIAGRLIGDGFVVFVPDFRLDCSPDDPPDDVDDPNQCGFNSPAPVKDLQRAVRWIRRNAGDYNAIPSQVASLGPSTGGHLSYMVSAVGIPDASAPDVTAGWSGASEMGYMADGVTEACSLSTDPGYCTNTEERYIGCALVACPDAWEVASPYSRATALAPPTFLVNATEEIVPEEQAFEYSDRLTDLGVANQVCLVESDMHGLSLQDLPCGEGEETVYESTIAFFRAHLPTMAPAGPS